MNPIELLLILGAVVLVSLLLCRSKDGYKGAVRGAKYPITQVSTLFAPGFTFDTNGPAEGSKVQVVITSGSAPVTYPIVINSVWTDFGGDMSIMGIPMDSIQNDPAILKFYLGLPHGSGGVTGYIQTV